MSPDGLPRVFGPVRSRRLGLSLGIDPVPGKTCSYDCVYCQLGRTTGLSVEPVDGPAPEDILAEVRGRLGGAGGPRPDYVTISGSGEPTLYRRLGELVEGLKKLGLPVAILTNGSLLWRPEVAEAAARADLVSPTLVSGSEATWRLVNRPHESIPFGRMLDGLVDFRSRFRGQLWLEVMLLAGVNDSDAEVRGMAEAAARIRPDRVQLNTPVRPPAEHSVRAVPRERLAELARLFDPPAEIIAAATAGGGGRRPGPVPAEEILASIARHPATAEEIAAALGGSEDDVAAKLAALAFSGRAAAVDVGGRRCWRAK